MQCGDVSFNTPCPNKATKTVRLTDSRFGTKTIYQCQKHFDSTRIDLTTVQDTKTGRIMTMLAEDITSENPPPE